MKNATKVIGWLTLGVVGVMHIGHATTQELTSEKERLSYTIGVEMGTSFSGFKKYHIEVEPQLVFQGMKDSLTGHSLKLTQEQMKQTMNEFQKKIILERQAELKQQAEKNKKIEEEFLAKNKALKGMKTTASGLQYRVVKEGAGAHPTDADKVEVEYTGKLIDGTVFDSTKKAGKPAVFPVTGVIPGWTEALKMMKPGAVWEVFIPAHLAYGERGQGPIIEPNQTLIFDIHLKSIQPIK